MNRRAPWLIAAAFLSVGLVSCSVVHGQVTQSPIETEPASLVTLTSEVDGRWMPAWLFNPEQESFDVKVLADGRSAVLASGLPGTRRVVVLVPDDRTHEVQRFVVKAKGTPKPDPNPKPDPDKPDPKPLAWLSDLKSSATARAKALGRPAAESLAVAKCFEPHLAATDFAKAASEIRAARVKALGLDAFLLWEPFAAEFETYLERYRDRLDATTAPLALKAIYEGLLDAGKSVSPALVSGASSPAASGQWVERRQQVCDPVTRTCRYETVREWVPTQP